MRNSLYTDIDVCTVKKFILLQTNEYKSRFLNFSFLIARLEKETEKVCRDIAASYTQYMYSIATPLDVRAGYRWAYDVIRPRGPSYRAIIAPPPTT